MATAADAVWGTGDVSYWREIPVNTAVFLALVCLALQARLLRSARGFSPTVLLTLIFISGQIQAGAGDLALVVLAISTSIISFWNRRGPWLGPLLAMLAIGGSRPSGSPSASHLGGPVSTQSLPGLGVTMISGLIEGHGVRVLTEAMG